LAIPLLLAVATQCTACSDGGDGGSAQPAVPYTPTPLPALTAAPLTDSETIVPSKARLAQPDARDPSVPDELGAMLADGFGDSEVGPGQAYTTTVLGGGTAPAPGPSPKLLVRFGHITDLHVVDDESPARMANLDAPEITSSAFRPEEAYACWRLNAMVRTLNRVSEDMPLDLVLFSGDGADSAQKNETEWLLGILDGSESVHCDSGADDDPVPGADNDPKDPFVAEGLAVPWYWTTGNHDVLRQGNLPVSEVNIALALGEDAVTGTRDWSQPGGPIFFGPVVPDADRVLQYRDELLAMVAADGDGHGLAQAQLDAGKADYTFDVAGTPLRFLVLDTASETGGADGLLRQGDVDTLITPALDQAQADGKWVILVSHHAVASLGDGTGLGGGAQPDAVSASAWTDLVGSYPNVIYSVVGHSHEERITAIEPSGGHGWFEVMTSALADFPSQGRVIEIWDQDNGWLMLRATAVDFATEGDPVAAEARKLGIADYVSGWGEDGTGLPEWRNAELWVPAPAG